MKEITAASMLAAVRMGLCHIVEKVRELLDVAAQLLAGELATNDGMPIEVHLGIAECRRSDETDALIGRCPRTVLALPCVLHYATVDELVLPVALSAEHLLAELGISGQHHVHDVFGKPALKHESLGEYRLAMTHLHYVVVAVLVAKLVKVLPDACTERLERLAIVGRPEHAVLFAEFHGLAIFHYTLLEWKLIEFAPIALAEPCVG